MCLQILKALPINTFDVIIVTHNMGIYLLLFSKSNQVDADIGIDSKHQTMQGVSFPITQDAFDKLLEVKSGSINYVQMVSLSSILHENKVESKL